jgi:hypothetical protein
MTEENTGAEAPAEEVVDLDADEKSDSSTEQQQDNETGAADAEPAKDGEASQEETGDDAPAKPRKAGVEKRIDELTRLRRDAERQAEYWKKRAEEAETQPTDDLEYEDQIAEKVRRANRKEQAETAEAQARHAADALFQARAEDARERYPDFDQVALNPSIPITPGMAEVIKDSDYGADLAYHLGKNPSEASRIAGLPVHRQAAELGRLEAKLSAPKPTPKTPPAPVKPVTGVNAGGTKDPAKMTMSEYIKWRESNP